MGLATTPKLAASSGAAHGTDATAAARATAQALEGLGSTPSLLLAFPSGLDPAGAAEAIAGLAPSVPVAGMTGNGSISGAGPIDSGCSVLALGPEVSVGLGVARGAGHDLNRAARHATAEALTGVSGRDNTLVLLFIDTRSGDQAAAIAGAYAVAGAAVPLVGGAAGGAEPAQLAGRIAHRDAVVAVAISSHGRAGVGAAHGCRSHGTPAIATRSEGRILYELDGRPAVEVYLERLGYAGIELSGEDFEALAVTHPLAQPELSGDSRVRHVLGRGPGKSLHCATHIPVNAAIEFTHQRPEEIVAASRRAVHSALKRLEGAAPAAALLFDCAGRKRAVGDGLAGETGAALGAFGSPIPPLAGLFSHGEIFRLRGAKGDRNHAIVAAVLD